MDIKEKYIIFHFVSHSDSFYSQTPEQEAESQQKLNNFFRSWRPRVKQLIGAHAMNMAGPWDWMGIFVTDELSDWEAFREEYRRRFPGRAANSMSYPGVSHTEFTRSTENVAHYKKLRELGQWPGMAEKEEKDV